MVYCNSCIGYTRSNSTLGYAHHSGLPYVESLWKNRYAGRSFIQSDPTLRKAAIAKKFGVLVDNFKDKRWGI